MNLLMKKKMIHTHKKRKDDKQCTKNYRPVSLLPISSKIFERLLFNELYKFFNENDLLSSNRSGFRPGDSCINQIISITYEIYQSFDNDLEVRGVFSDISKAFDKVWNGGLILKLSRNGISGNLLNLLKDFLKYRKQRVLLNGQNSSWTGITSGVPQGSILRTLFFIYINDLLDDLSPNCKLFADDTSLFSVVHDVFISSSELSSDLAKISEWAFKWKMIFNPDPSKSAQEVNFSRKLKTVPHPSVTFNNNPLSLCPAQSIWDWF